MQDFRSHIVVMKSSTSGDVTLNNNPQIINYMWHKCSIHSVSGQTEPVWIWHYDVFTSTVKKWKLEHNICFYKYGSIYGSDRNPSACMSQVENCWACKIVFQRNILKKIVTHVLTKYYSFLLHLNMQPLKALPSLSSCASLHT